MDFKIKGLFILTYFILFSCKSQLPTQSITLQKESFNELNNSKKYALCSCLKIKGYRLTDSLKTDQSAYAYISKGTKHPQFYKQIYNFTKAKVSSLNYKSFKGKNYVLPMVECIDFYESKELENFIKSINNKNFNE